MTGRCILTVPGVKAPLPLYGSEHNVVSRVLLYVEAHFFALGYSREPGATPSPLQVPGFSFHRSPLMPGKKLLFAPQYERATNGLQAMSEQIGLCPETNHHFANRPKTLSKEMYEDDARVYPDLAVTFSGGEHGAA